MEKRILADYRWQDYRAQAAQLDELAQAGWQLQSEGVLGLIFTETEPAERHHRVIYVPKDEEFLPPADWMVVYRKREKVILARDTAMTLAEELALDQAMRPQARKVLIRNILQLVSLAVTVLAFCIPMALRMDGDYQLLWELLPPLGQMMLVGTAVLLASQALTALLDMGEVLRFHWAVVDEILYEPLMRGYRLHWLSKMLIVGLCSVLLLVILFSFRGF